MARGMNLISASGMFPSRLLAARHYSRGEFEDGLTSDWEPQLTAA